MKNGKVEVPMTSFIDFVLKSGSPKMTCAKKIKKELSQVYAPEFDYYKRFRDAIQDLHKKGWNKKDLDKLIGHLPDNKEDIYKQLMVGYNKFLGTKQTTWFDPPRKKWEEGNLSIPVNPELGLQWGQDKYLIKLYHKSDKPSKDRCATILALMKSTFNSNDYQYALLDVRNSKLYLYEDNMLTLIPLARAEARALELILEQI